MVVSDSLKSHVWTVDKHELIMAQLEDLFPTLVLACTVYSGVTALFSFLMVLGVKCESRCLMIPFLILSMVDIIVAGAAGVVVVVALFFLNTIPGAVSLVVYVMVAVVSLYSWAVVLAAYREVGLRKTKTDLTFFTPWYQILFPCCWKKKLTTQNLYLGGE